MNIEEIKDKFCRPTDERALLALCVKDMDSYYDLVSHIDSRDFLRLENSLIYSIMRSMADRGAENFDLPMLINEAQSNGVLGSIGGIEYLHSINDMQVSRRNLKIYIDNVLEASTKFRLYCTLKKNMDEIEINSKDGKVSAELIGDIEGKILDLSTESKAIREPINMSEGLRELIEKRRENPVEYLGLQTPFPILNKQIDGLVPGTLTIISARPKMGKSTVLSNIAAHIAFREQTPVLYVDTEMDFNQWRDRIVAGMSGIKERIIKHGNYDEETYHKIINKCINIVERGKLYHEFMPGYTVEQLVAIYKKYKIKKNIGLMVFDYIKEPSLTSTAAQQRKEYQVLGDVTTKLKDLAGELQIPALAAVQINREGKVADSDRIARYADIICEWTYRTKDELEAGGQDCGSHKLIVRETRRGGATPDEGIGYNFWKQQLRIKEVVPELQLIMKGEDVVNHGSADDELR